MGKKNLPQGLKPEFLEDVYGTTQVVPLQIAVTLRAAPAAQAAKKKALLR
jgi:hypothetical protein